MLLRNNVSLVWQITTHGPDLVHHLFLKKKFYWHVGTPFIYLYILYGFFHTIMVELSACNRHGIAHEPKTFPIGPLRKMFANHWSSLSTSLCRKATKIYGGDHTSPLSKEDHTLSTVSLCPSSCHWVRLSPSSKRGWKRKSNTCNL